MRTQWLVGLCFAVWGCGGDDAKGEASSGGTSSGGAASGGSSSGGSSSGGSGNASGGGSASGGSATGGGGGSTPLPAADFEARCNAPGVLVCRGFDSESELNHISLESETGAEPNNNGSYDHIGIDTNEKASGAGSLRFEIVGKTGANHSGAYRQLFGEAFGEGETFYSQFRLRVSNEFIDTDWDGVVGSAPKIVIFHNSSATCNDIEWTQVANGWYDRIPTMYTHCGQYGGNIDVGGQLYLQQGDYQCAYNSDYLNNPECLKYPKEKWMTFYFQGTIGTWGEPNSRLQAWFSVDGQPYQKWTDYQNFTLYAEGDSLPGFDSAYLTTYMTAKDSSADHATAYVWYDELIVSSEPIAPPE
jgi:hypothetical protein